MNVSCDGCGALYNVREEKLPPGGGKIQCPQCGNVFVVRPPQPLDAATTAEQPPPPLSDDQELPTRDSRAVDDEALVEDAFRTWKLKIGGLTYAFHSTESLQQWLSARDNLDSVQLSRAGEAWSDLASYEEVLTPGLMAKLSRRGPVTSEPQKPSEHPVETTRRGPAPTRAPQPAPASSTPAPRALLTTSAGMPTIDRASLSARQASATRPAHGAAPGARKPRQPRPAPAPARSIGGDMIKYVLALLVVLIAAVGLHAADVIDLGAVLPSLRSEKNEMIIVEASSPIPAPDPAPATNSRRTIAPDPQADPTRQPTLDPEEQARRDAEEAARAEAARLLALTNNAREFLQANQPQAAIVNLEQVVEKQPDDIAVLQLLEQAYEAAGQRAQRDAISARLRPLLAQRHLAAGEHKEAAALLERLVREARDNVLYHEQLLQAYEALGDARKAARVRRQLEALRPDEPPPG